MSCGSLLKNEISRGIIPFWLNEEGKIFYLIIQHIHGSHWAFPKGHPDKKKNESKLDNAKREFTEETGISHNHLFIIPLNYYQQRDNHNDKDKDNDQPLLFENYVNPRNGRNKTTEYFIAQIKLDHLTINDNNNSNNTSQIKTDNHHSVFINNNFNNTIDSSHNKNKNNVGFPVDLICLDKKEIKDYCFVDQEKIMEFLTFEETKLLFIKAHSYVKAFLNNNQK